MLIALNFLKKFADEDTTPFLKFSEQNIKFNQNA